MKKGKKISSRNEPMRGGPSCCRHGVTVPFLSDALLLVPSSLSELKPQPAAAGKQAAKERRRSPGGGGRLRRKQQRGRRSSRGSCRQPASWARATNYQFEDQRSRGGQGGRSARRGRFLLRTVRVIGSTRHGLRGVFSCQSSGNTHLELECAVADAVADTFVA